MHWPFSPPLARHLHRYSRAREGRHGSRRPRSVEKLASESVLELVAALRPAVYSNGTLGALAAALLPDGVTPGQMWIDECNVRATASMPSATHLVPARSSRARQALVAGHSGGPVAL
jgi:hypothetical protein